MANKEHLDILNRGIQAWNEWKRQNPDTKPDLIGANLSWADLSGAAMVQTNLNKANLTECRIYGVSAWDLKLQETIQLDLIITFPRDPKITVDNIEVAQFIYSFREKNTLALKEGTEYG